LCALHLTHDDGEMDLQRKLKGLFLEPKNELKFRALSLREFNKQGPRFGRAHKHIKSSEGPDVLDVFRLHMSLPRHTRQEKLEEARTALSIAQLTGLRMP